MAKKLIAGLVLGIGLMTFVGMGACRDMYPDSRMNALDKMVVGDKSSRVYHCESCNLAKNVDPNNRTGFKSVEDALAAGYVACPICEPEKK